ncbi:MAG TPA: hypothetical protein VHH73_01330, partial [Verrucomicrobiae bacterium]|nr:hypothetical protein [Verrucomicrobiae bacterium]
PGGNFSANGYADGLITGNGVLKGQRAFNGDSPDYKAGKFITSKALLGAYRKDDSIVVQFLGAWDDCSAQLHPSWEIDSMSLTLLPMIITDFVTTNAGFTVENSTPPPPGPWIYNSTNGLWVADGSEDACTGPYNSKLTSTAFVAPESDEVTLSFTHRYSFESGGWDGGQVRLSVNGGPFNPVTADKFSANGYATANIVGNGILKDQRGFNGDSPGFATNNLITSSAVLGTFKKGDTLQVQFVGAWDDCSGQLHPSWTIKNLQLAFGKAAKASTFDVAATASRQGTPVPVAYQWQRDDGTGFVDIAGATGPSFRIFPVATDFAASFRVVTSVPGKTVISSVVKLTEGTVEAPTLSIAKSGAAVVVTYTGTLQSAPAVSGPYQPVASATSPYTVPAGTTAIYFRSAK